MAALHDWATACRELAFSEPGALLDLVDSEPALLELIDSAAAAVSHEITRDETTTRSERAATRLVAAEVILKSRGGAAADEFIKDATKSDARRELSFGLADLLVKLNDPESKDKEDTDTVRSLTDDKLVLVDKNNKENEFTKKK